MKTTYRPLIALSLALAIQQSSRFALADSLYWDGTSTDWSNPAAWSTSPDANTPDPAAPPGAADLAIFNISSVTSPQTVTLDAPQSVSGLVISSTGSVFLQSNPDSSTLSLGSAGIVMNASAGPTTLALPVSLADSQTWTNNSFNLLSAGRDLTLGTSTLTLLGTGNVNFTGNVSSTHNSVGGLNMLGTGSLTLTGLNTLDANLTIADGTVKITQTLSNNSNISLTSSTSKLIAVSIINNGSTRGNGTINTAITNNGIVEPTGGMLSVDIVNNSPSGLVRIAPGNTLALLQLKSTNSGEISMAGGTLESGILVNAGRISGFGTINSVMFNQGTITFTGGSSAVYDQIQNDIGSTINICSPTAFYDLGISNFGTVNTSSTTVTFNAYYSGKTYISNRSTNIFHGGIDITLGGLMSGGTEDQFIIDRGNSYNYGIFTNGGLLQCAAPVTNGGTFTQTGPQSWAPGSLFTNFGTATFASDCGSPSAVPLSITSSGTLTFQTPQHLDNLTLTGGTTTLQFSPTTLNPLTLDHAATTYAAQLDLTTSPVILQSSSPADKLAKITGLLPAIAAGSNNNTWTGQGITSSTAAQDPAHYAVALFDNADLQLTSIGTQPLDPNSLLLTLAHLGDANNNGTIDAQDQSTITNHWQSAQSTWSSGDLNLDGFVDLQDLTLVTNHWQQSSDFSIQNSAFSIPASIPEPASLLLLAPALLLHRKPHRPCRPNRHISLDFSSNIFLLASLVACATWATPARAEDLVYSDLGVHTLTTVESRQIVLAGRASSWPFGPTQPVTTLEVLPGGDAAGGVTTDAFGCLQIHGGTVSGTINAGATVFPWGQLPHGLRMEMTDGSFGVAGLGLGTATISGGTGQNLGAGGSYGLTGGALTMTGGTLQKVSLGEGAVGKLAGGTVESLFLGYGSQTTISGATVGSVSLGSGLAIYPRLTITGGTVGPISNVAPQAVVTVSGGNLTGGISGYVITLELQGSQFSKPFGHYTDPGRGHISGVLADGSPLDLDYTLGGGGPEYHSYLTLTQVPEPSTLLWLAPAVYFLLPRVKRSWARESHVTVSDGG